MAFNNEMTPYSKSGKGSIQVIVALSTLIFIISGCNQSQVFNTPDFSNDLNQPLESATSNSSPIQIYPPTSEDEGWFLHACDQTSFNPITDFQIQAVPSINEPMPRLPFVDPTFGTCIVRVTDRIQDISSGDISKGLKNEYSRVQSFNADETLLLAYSTDGNWYLYNALSLQLLGQLPISHEPRWDAVDPDLLYFSEGTRFLSYQISSGEETTIHDFANDFPNRDLSAVWMKYEGSPSFNGRYWGLMAEDQNWMTIAFVVYDLETDQVIALRDTPPSEIDSVTISPLGNYFLAYFDNYCEHGAFGTEEDPCGLMVYDASLEHGRNLLRIIGHSDVALDSQNMEVLVYQDIDTDTISMLNLSSGMITPLLQINFSHSAIGLHFSGQASHSPGWILVSTSNGSDPSATWMDDQIFAVELLEIGRIIRLAHTQSIVDSYIDHDYWAEPHASVNRDFTQIVFTSNWGRKGTDEVDMFMIKLPEDWVSRIP